MIAGLVSDLPDACDALQRSGAPCTCSPAWSITAKPVRCPLHTVTATCSCSVMHRCIAMCKGLHAAATQAHRDSHLQLQRHAPLHCHVQGTPCCSHSGTSTASHALTTLSQAAPRSQLAVPPNHHQLPHRLHPQRQRALARVSGCSTTMARSIAPQTAASPSS
jgi:hypothetical protein